MSEMFTKCNGFIVSGDPLVYADSATMTGQGTVSEPFGVKSTDLFVQEPLYTGTSGNSAYIGWNNETVLWEAGDIANRTSACTLSESLKNFEHVDVWLAHATYGPTRAISLDFNVMGNTGYFNVLRPRGDGNLNAAFMFLTADATHIACTKSKCVMFGSYTSTAASPTGTLNDSEDRNCLYKVVGINRKV